MESVQTLRRLTATAFRLAAASHNAALASQLYEIGREYETAARRAEQAAAVASHDRRGDAPSSRSTSAPVEIRSIGQ